MSIKRNNPQVNENGNLKIKKSPYEEFGVFMIHTVFLDDNLLLVKYKSYSPVPSIRRTKISEDLSNILKDLLVSSEINYNLLNDLSDKEIDLFDNLITKAKLKTLLNYKKSKIKLSPEKLKMKYNILKGEIIAGNDNAEIIKDIEKLLPQLIESDIITQEIALEIKYLINHLNE